MINYDKPFQTKDGTEATLIKVVDGDQSFKWMVEFVDSDGDRNVDMFDEDGDSLNGVVELENLPEETSSPVAGGPVILPPLLQVQVRHAKYGVGTVLKLRQHPTKTMLVRYPGRDQSGTWSFDKHLSRV
ncbi:MAG: hypothetical protein KDK08_05415 [Rhizobiaceae bacterium]|nr:hypothetical protein [Rhizobiaceae bacterium]MCC0000908.1 hypothetical protein [Methylobacteriaceae bacterium]